MFALLNCDHCNTLHGLVALIDYLKPQTPFPLHSTVDKLSWLSIYVIRKTDTLEHCYYNLYTDHYNTMSYVRTQARLELSVLSMIQTLRKWT